MSVVFAIAMLCAASITKLGGHMIDQQRAQHAANAAALAAVYDEEVVEILSSRNGGELVNIDDHHETDGTITVLVRVGQVLGSATAFDTWFETTPTLEP